MDNPLEMPMLDRITDHPEELHSIANGELMPLGILRDRLRPGDVLHDEIGRIFALIMMSPRLVDLGNTGMPEPGEDLAFKLESAKRRSRDDPSTHELDCNRASWIVLYGLVHGAHATGTDELPQCTWPDFLTRAIARRRLELMRVWKRTRILGLAAGIEFLSTKFTHVSNPAPQRQQSIRIEHHGTPWPKLTIPVRLDGLNDLREEWNKSGSPRLLVLLGNAHATSIR